MTLSASLYSASMLSMMAAFTHNTTRYDTAHARILVDEMERRSRRGGVGANEP